MNTTDMIDALVIAPGDKPRPTRIPNTLQALQDIVGGYIEVVGLGPGTACYVNEEGKFLGLEPNRGLRDRSGRLYDVIMGTFVITGFDEDTGDNTSLTPEQTRRLAALFARTDLI